MSLVTSSMAGPFADALASALLHFIWQGAVLAAAAWAAMRWLRTSAAARYVVGVATLAAMLAMPVASVLMTTPATAVRAAAASALAPVADAPGRVVSSMPPATPATERRVAPFVALAWLAGVVLLSVRLAGGWLVARRLAVGGVRAVDVDVQRLAARVSDRLGVGRLVRVAASSAVAVPVVVGWLKPVVLVPAAALSGLTPAQLEALFAHELAHVRRHDYLVNLLQSVVETLLFYHPAVWWVSRCVRVEREHCCDDLAVSVCDRVVYVDALTELAAMGARPRLALAATDGSLLSRVRRLLEHPADGRAASGWAAVLAVVAIAVGASPAGLLGRGAQEAPQPPAAAADAVPVSAAPGAVVPVALPRPAARSGNLVVSRAVAIAAPQQADPASRMSLARERVAAAQAGMNQLERDRRTLEARRVEEEVAARRDSKRAELEAVGAELERLAPRADADADVPPVVEELRRRRLFLEHELRLIEADATFAAAERELASKEADHREEFERSRHELVAAEQAFHEALERREPLHPRPLAEGDLPMHQVPPVVPPAPPDAPRPPAPSARPAPPLPPPPPAPPGEGAMSGSPVNRWTLRLPPPPPPPGEGAIDPAAVVRAGDSFAIEVEGNDALSVAYTVAPDGTINLPRAGSVVVGGLTFKQALDIMLKEAVATGAAGQIVQVKAYRLVSAGFVLRQGP